MQPCGDLGERRGHTSGSLRHWLGLLPEVWLRVPPDGGSQVCVCVKVRVMRKAHDQVPTDSAKAATRDPVGLERVAV